MSSDLAIDAELLLKHYDHLTAVEVVEGLRNLSAEQLSEVKRREVEGKNRVTVLRGIAALHGAAQHAPAESPSRAEIIRQAADLFAAEPAPQPPAAPPSYGYDVGPQLSHEELARLHQIAAVRQKAMKSILFWGLAVVVAIVVSVATYLNAGEGDRYFLWWGPVVFGIWRMIASTTVLFRLRNL